jgi:hypothetical protein
MPGRLIGAATRASQIWKHSGEHHELGKASGARYRALPDRKVSTYKRVPLRHQPGRRRAR